MSIEYRLTAIGDDDEQREIGIIGSLLVPPNSILVMSLPPDTLDSDLARLREEWRELAQQWGWDKVPSVIIRAGDIRFACLTRVETPDA